MKTIKTIIALFCLIQLLTLTGCIGDSFDFEKLSTHVQVQSRWTFPVVYGTLTINDLIEQTDSTSPITILTRDTVIIRFKDKIASKSAEDIVSMNDKTYTQLFTVTDFNNAGGFINNQALLTKNEPQYPFDDLNAYIINRALMTHSDLVIKVNSNLIHQGFLTLRFPQITYLGQTFTYTIDLAGGINNVIRNIPLDNYEIDYSKQFLPGTNFIEYRLTLLDNGSGTFPVDNQMQIYVEFNNNSYGILYGYIGQIEYQMDKSKINFDVFNSITNGTAEFGNPRLWVHVINSFGLPVRFGFTELYGKKANSDLIINITGGSMYDTNPITLRKPSLEGYPNITPIDTILRPINPNNSNLGLVLGALPEYIGYSTKFLVNPASISDSMNFLLNTSKLDVNLTMEIPLHIRTSGLTLIDTLPFTIDLDSSLWNWIQTVKLKVEINNGFPHNIQLQGILTNDNYIPIDSLFPRENTRMLIESGRIDPNTGRIDQQTGKSKKETIVEISGTRVENLKNVTKIIIVGQYATPFNQSGTQDLVIYYDNYSVDVKITMDIELSINDHL